MKKIDKNWNINIRENILNRPCFSKNFCKIHEGLSLIRTILLTSFSVLKNDQYKQLAKKWWKWFWYFFRIFKEMEVETNRWKISWNENESNSTIIWCGPKIRQNTMLQNRAETSSEKNSPKEGESKKSEENVHRLTPYVQIRKYLSHRWRRSIILENYNEESFLDRI